MRRKKVGNEWKHVFWVVLYLGILSMSEIFLKYAEGEKMSELLWYSICGRITKGDISALLMSMETLGLVFLFCLLFGGYIADYFDSNSAVYFTRVHDRGRWVTGRIRGILLISALYTLLVLGIKTVITRFKMVSWVEDTGIVWTFLLIFGVFFTLIVISCLTTNWISIHYSVPIGVVSCFGILILLRYLAMAAPDHPLNIIGNPMCMNVVMINDFAYGIMKIGINVVYLMLIYIGMRIYIEKKDIF